MFLHSTFPGKGFTLGGKKRPYILTVNRYLIDPLSILRANLHLSVTYYMARKKVLFLELGPEKS